MLESEDRLVPYLFKLRHTLKVKALVQRMMGEGALWQDCGDGWQGLGKQLALDRLEPGAAPYPRARSSQPRAPRRGGPGI